MTDYRDYEPLKKRQLSQKRADNWPFLFSFVEGRGIVKNVPAAPPATESLRRPDRPKSRKPGSGPRYAKKRRKVSP